MSIRKPNKNSPATNRHKGSKKSHGARGEHLLYAPLITALQKYGVKLSGAGTAEYQRLNFLKKYLFKKRDAKLTKTQRKHVDSLFALLKEAQCPKKTLDELSSLASGVVIGLEKLGNGTIADYLDHIQAEIGKVRSDPILHRLALAAKAWCLEFEQRWSDLITTLQEIIRIEETQLHDPVEAARTRTRAAEACIEEDKNESLALAKTLLFEGLKGIAKNDNVRRTKLELLLSLAHVHLHLGEHTLCEKLLTRDCRPLLEDLRMRPNEGCYPALVADYDVRLGVALKVLGKDLQTARMHLIAGALRRAKLKHFAGTAHAIRHLGDLYEKTLDWIDGPRALRRALWFYLAEIAVFQNRNPMKEARAHLHCAKVLRSMAAANHESTEQAQREALISFGKAISSEFEGDEAELVAEIQNHYASPHSTQEFAQPYRKAALAHYRECIVLVEKCGGTNHTAWAKEQIAAMESEAANSKETTACRKTKTGVKPAASPSFLRTPPSVIRVSDASYGTSVTTSPAGGISTARVKLFGESEG